MAVVTAATAATATATAATTNLYKLTSATGGRATTVDRPPVCFVRATSRQAGGAAPLRSPTCD